MRLPPRVRKARARGWRWQSSRRAHPAAFSIPVSRRPFLRQQPSKLQFSLPRIRIASPVRRVRRPPTFADSQCRRKRTDRRELHSAFARRNFRSTRKLRSLWFSIAPQSFSIVLPLQISSLPPPLRGSPFLGLAPHTAQ